VLSAVGVQPRQYRLLVELFGQLGERKELLGNLGTDRHAMNLTSLGLLLPGLIVALFAFGPGSLASFNMMTLAMSAMVLVMLLVMEGGNSFFNPAEVAVLAHRPIAGATYFAAKLTYLVVVVFRSAAALNLPSALAGLVKPEARWFYPLTHMVAAWCTGLFLALLVCSLFGVLLRTLPGRRIRAAALWMQLGVTLLPLVFNLAMRPLRRLLASAGATVEEVDWSFVPLTWFNAIAVAGQDRPVAALGWPVLAGVAASAVIVAFGVRSLSAGYMTRIVGIMRTGRSAAGRRRRSSLAGRSVAALSGGPPGHAAFAFVARMMRRDWQFRRVAVQFGFLLFVFVPAMVLSGRETSPFATETLPPIGLLPVLLALMTLFVCGALSYSDHYKAAWLFRTAPGDGLRCFIRGIYFALWLPFLALPLAAALIFYTPYWGLRDAVLFTTYGLAVASFLFGLQLLLVQGLPFSQPPRADRTVGLVPFILFGPVAAAVAWVLQGQLLFRSRLLTTGAALLFSWLALATARYTLRELEQRTLREVESGSGG
jgi:hypothetical protein